MRQSNSPASQAIAMLIDLAEKGEIDPWDVQVIQVIDRFLAELGIDDSNNLCLPEADLSQSGQVMLWASMLVLYKADTLQKIGQKEETEAINPGESNDFEDDYQPKQIINESLAQQIKRRTAAPPPLKRKVTLTEFINQLQAMENELKQAQLTHRLPLRKKKNYTRKQALKTITELAHNENLTELAQELNHFLQHKFSNFINHSSTLRLEELVNHWQQHKKKEKQDKVGLFWALLLLSSQSKVELSQEEFYQDLNITLIVEKYS
jgi:segregation and condensation protein A